MHRPLFRRLMIATCATLSCSFIVAGFSTSLQAESAARQVGPTANPPVDFAQGHSDLAVDPTARFGKLPNGMTYVLYRNRTPPGAAAVWLRIAAGSMMEQEDQRGLAHFIEHMAFNGSKNVPEGEMVKLLERDGLAFGADTNAQTNSHETLYTLNLPDASDRILDDALFLMRETAGNLTFDPGAINRERGVVLGEERARGGPSMQAYEAQLKQMFPGQKYSERLPIGHVSVLKNAQRPAFTRFYNDFYRPEYATLIVAGDIDVDRVEGEIRRRFGDWRPAPQSPAGLTDFGELTTTTRPVVQEFTGAGLPDTLSVSWVAPPRDVVQTKGKDFDDLLALFANNILNERLERAAGVPTAAFVSAGVQREGIRHTGRIFSFVVRPKAGQQAAAFAQGMAIVRAFVAGGPTQDELDRLLKRYDSYFKGRAAAARTIATPDIVGRIANAVRSYGVLQSPAQELAEFEELRPSFTRAAMLAAMKQLRLDSPPHLWIQGEKATSFDSAAMLAAYHAAIAAPVVITTAPAAASWPYERFGTPSPIVSRKALALVGATRITFGNGVVLTVKPTDFDDDNITVSVNVGNGILGVPKNQATALFAARQLGLVPGGLGKLPADDMREALAGSVYGLSFSIGADATTLSGATTKMDFARQMQVLTAFVTDPAFRPEPLERFKSSLAATYANLRASPDGVYSLRADAAMFGDDPRFAMPPEEDLRAVENKDIAALLKAQLTHGPIEVTIVGDVTVDAAIRQVGETFGSLPPSPAAVAAIGADVVRFPTANLHQIYAHQGRGDQNISVVAWPTADYYSDTRRAAGLQLLAAIIASRALDEVREKQGASYSAKATSASSTTFAGFGYLETSAAVRPEDDDRYYRTVSIIARELRTNAIGTDELSRARLPMIDRLRNQRNTNGYWLAILSGSLREPSQITASQNQERDLNSITTKDIQSLARTYLVPGRELRIQVRPVAANS